MPRRWPNRGGCAPSQDVFSSLVDQAVAGWSWLGEHTWERRAPAGPASPVDLVGHRHPRVRLLLVIAGVAAALAISAAIGATAALLVGHDTTVTIPRSYGWDQDNPAQVASEQYAAEADAGGGTVAYCAAQMAALAQALRTPFDQTSGPASAALAQTRARIGTVCTAVQARAAEAQFSAWVAR